MIKKIFLMIAFLYCYSFATYMTLTRIWDSGADTASVDSISQSLQIIGYEHHENHSGNHYVFSFDTTLGSGDTMQIAVRCDTLVSAHIVFEMATKEATYLRLYEKNAYVAGDTGTARTVICQNRVTNAGVNTAVRVGGRSTDSTLLFRQYLTSDNSLGMQVRENSEWILSPQKYYMFKVISGAATNVCNFRFYWYEE
jgi:hypothetical protein